MIFELKPVKRPRLSTEILMSLQRSIRRGELTPGDRLPAERELADGLGVSRNSIREALRALEVLGVVETRHGEGTYVRSPDMTTLLGPVFGVLVSKREFILEVLEFRRVLEPALCRLAATRATDADIERLRSILAEQDERIRVGAPASDVDMEFHRSIAMATHNSIVSTTLEFIATMLQEFRDVWGEGRPASSTEAHRQVFDAIARRDGDAAALAMEVHVRQVHETVCEEIAVLSGMAAAPT